VFCRVMPRVFDPLTQNSEPDSKRIVKSKGNFVSLGFLSTQERFGVWGFVM